MNLAHCEFRNHTTGSLNFFELLEELLFALERRIFENEFCFNRIFLWVLSKRLLGLQIPTGQWNNNLQARSSEKEKIISKNVCLLQIKQDIKETHGFYCVFN